ncbi:hypothetical protein THRCLA_06542 [Thraustotheca clavata]|uniref:RBR-type E3 ubiquitin transferase n=1 Tax=Thraustotheca clavata TaxID=74557 RepID=A0A1V9ZN37_9STRA|nr:hypothetical protein THRCLA_06542 [Thraustotheca clavata]
MSEEWEVYDEEMWNEASWDDAPEKKCVICLDDPPFNDDSYQCIECNAICCHECYSNYLTHQIINGQVSPEQLVCVGSCHRSIVLDQIRVFVSDEIVQKYISFLQAFEQRQRGDQFCPHPLCGRPLQAQENDKRRLHCASCNRTMCRNCGQEYHRWPKCDKKYRSWCKSHHVQSCPQCNALIEKNDGCKHMTCGQCRYQFCWLCRGDWPTHGTRCKKLSERYRTKHFGASAKPIKEKPPVVKSAAKLATKPARAVFSALRRKKE